MVRSRVRGAVPIALTLAALVTGQPAAALESEGALWALTQWSFPIVDGVGLHFMTQSRVVDDLGAYERTVVRPWVSIALPARFELALGYDGHLFESPISGLESRAWQRIAYSHDWGGFSSQIHFWQEERFFEGSREVAWRSRINIGVTIPLRGSVQAIVRNELFFDLNATDVIRSAGLGEDHLYVGLRRPLNAWITADAGYLMQYRRSPAPGRIGHTLLLGFAVTMPSLSGSAR